jgi:putative flavoprotein involved in K+ transport
VPHTSVVIIGAGQAGLAMSHCLSARHIDHVVLERGMVGERWRRHGWDSLRLLTPNWMTRLPGFSYDGDDPDGFMATGELVQLLEAYATASRVPVEDRTIVRRVEPWNGKFRVATNRGAWLTSAVVVATGYCDRPAIPGSSRRLAPSIQQLTPERYRNPEQLSRNGVLIVGASATGVQLAEEIQRSGRPVVLAVGRHTRLPRVYRGQDILWWLDRLGILSQDAASVHNIAISRRQPSLQLVGRPDHSTVDLAVLRARGVRLVGRLVGIDRSRIQFADDLISTTAAADIKMATVLIRIDDYIRRHGLEVEDAAPFVPSWSLNGRDTAEIDARHERIETVIWATGYRREYPWLRVPVLNAHGEIAHTGGVTPYRGVYVLGMNFQRRRNSSFIDGVGSDAGYLAERIARELAAGDSKLKVC